MKKRVIIILALLQTSIFILCLRLFVQVSYSNPVRQSLFTFEDCQKGGRDKALAAADALKKIFPAVTAKGYSLTIPMPAHPLSSSTEAEVREQYCQLEELIKRYKNVHSAGVHRN